MRGSGAVIVALVLVLAGCTEKGQSGGGVAERPADRPAVALGLRDVLDLVIPESEVSVADLERLDVDVAGTTAVVGYPANRVTVWDLASRDKTGEILLPPGSGLLELSPDGKSLAASDGKGVLSVWNIPERRQVTSMRAEFFGLGFSPGGDRLAFGSDDGITVLDTRTGAVTARLTASEMRPLLPDSDLGDGEPGIVGSGEKDPVNEVHFTADGTIVASSFSYWLSWRPGGEPVVVAPDYGLRTSVLSPDRSRLLLVSELGLFTWDVDARKQVGTAELPGGDINSIDGVTYDATGSSLIVLWQERFPVDPAYTFTRVVEHIDSYRLPALDPIRSDTVTYFTGAFTERRSATGGTSGDLVLVTVGSEHLIMRDGLLITGPEFAVCAGGITCREGFALQHQGGYFTLMKWMYGRWRPMVAGERLTRTDLEREGLYAPYVAGLFPEANVG